MMTRQSLTALPIPSSILSSHTVTNSLHRCQCGKRYQCNECRRYWIGKRSRAAEAWLRDAIADDGKTWFGLFTVPTSGEWMNESNELFTRWTRLGKQRSQQRYRRNQSGLASIKRGIGCLYLVSSAGRYQPHLHAVVVSDRAMDSRALIEAWQSMGMGFCDIQPAESIGAVVRYSIAGPLPIAPSERTQIAAMMRGIRVVRRIGK